MQQFNRDGVTNNFPIYSSPIVKIRYFRMNYFDILMLLDCVFFVTE